VGKRDDAHPEFIMRGAYGSATARLRTDILSTKQSDLFPNEAAKNMWVGQAAVDTIMGRIYNIGLRNNKNYTYSCLNFCLLMDLEQRVTGQSHDRWVTDSIWAPLGAYDACYRPTLSHSLDNIAPTENDTYLRRQLVHGYVHDETAAMLGGVSGNAGVFATATDLAKICQMWLNGGKYGDVQVLSPSTVDLFMTSKTPNSRRGLGFDKPDKENERNSPICEEADASVVGHTGFTGTAFWIDPKNDLIYIILANRVNPTRDNDNFPKANLRPGIFTQVYNSLK
jgi:CubicO group peptidase (beta-lactamase class C family)